ncbi:MAG: nucleotidyltransferase family protein [Candidatus Limnocylindria bacterium]
MQVAAVVLAAGASSRFGSPKQLARIGERTMLETVTTTAHEAGLDPVIAVVPPGMAVPPNVVPEINPAPNLGLSHSLRLGLAAVPLEIGGAAILLGDQPSLRAITIKLLLEVAAPERPVIAAFANGRIGPPVLLSREAFGLAEEARGDEGLRTILARHPELVTAVDVGEHVPDVDTPADLERLGDG